MCGSEKQREFQEAQLHEGLKAALQNPAHTLYDHRFGRMQESKGKQHGIAIGDDESEYAEEEEEEEAEEDEEEEEGEKPAKKA